MERGRIQGLPKLFEYPLLSQERIKLYEFQIWQVYSQGPSEESPLKFWEKMERERIQGTHILGASRGLLCDSSAVLF